MESSINLYTFTENIEQAQRSDEVLYSRRNIIEFQLHFDKSDYSESILAENVINQLKSKLIKALQTKYCFYWLYYDHVNGHKSISNRKIGRKIDSDDLTFMYKVYTIPELDLTLGAAIERWIPNHQELPSNKTAPNILYLHDRCDLVSQATVDSFMTVLVQNAFTTKGIDPLLQFKFEFLLTSYLDHTKLCITQLRQGDLNILKLCHVEMLDFKSELN